MAVISPIRRPATIVYPESDGKPMGETDIHREQIITLINALNDRYRDDPMVYVSGDLLVYYAEGDPRQVVSPDTFVVFGVPKRKRRIYKVWEERKAPDVVFEVTSKKTRRQDTQEKPGLYARLGVREYFLFDPLNEYLHPPLQGYRLVEGVYIPIAPEPGSDGDIALPSEILGLMIRREEGWLRLYDARTGERLFTPEEVQVARREAEARVRQEATARQALEARLLQAEEEIHRLKAEVERLRQGKTE